MGYEIGQRLADYEIVGLLGSGGMGRVYRVRNTISHRIEAMKVLLADLGAEADQAARFLSEIRTLAGLSHPHIAQLHTAMQAGNELMMMMEYVEGSTLQELSQQAPLAAERVIDYVQQVLAALSFAHGRGVIHRDIKPGNIMVTPQGVVKLTDFGIAKSKVRNELTRPGTTVGSLNYMSPEQAHGGCAIDGRADLYSLGITMYELLAGRCPFEDESSYVILHSQLNVEPRPPIALNPQLSPSLNDLILKALQKDPAKRFQSAAAFSKALHEASGIAAPTPVENYDLFVPATDFVPANAKIIPPRVQAKANWIAAGVLVVAGVSGFVAYRLPHFSMSGALAKTVGHSINLATPVSNTARAHGDLSNSGQRPDRVPAAPPVTQSSGKGPANGITAGLDTVTVAKDGEKPSTLSVTPGGVPVKPKAAAPPLRGPFHERAVSRPSRAEVAVASLAEDKAEGEEVPKPAAPPTSTPAELLQLRNQGNGLDARASTLRLSVQRLKSQQEAAGEGLSQDIAGAYVRMNVYLGAGKTDLEDGDAAAARNHLAKAETEVNVLEKLFNR